MKKLNTIMKSFVLLGITGLLSACGGGDSGPNPNTILNGSFETSDYSSWTLTDSNSPAAGIFANLPAGISLPAGTLFDHESSSDIDDSCLDNTITTFPESIVSDGSRTGLHVQTTSARHTMHQDVFIQSNATGLLWDLAYESATALSASQYIALNIIDPVSLAVLDTPFKLDPVVDPVSLPTFTTFEVDVVPYRGQTIRIELEMQVQDFCFTVFFDNFRID